MKTGGISTSPDTLSLIVDALVNLRRLDGSGTDDEIWSFANTCVEPTKLPKTPDLLQPALQSAAIILQRLEGVKNTLLELSQSCERKLAGLRSQLEPSFLHYGIQSLPNDVLSYMFKLAVDDYAQHEELLPELVLSHVCKHFRTIAIGTPSLWSRVVSEMTVTCLNRHLELSGVASLTIIILENEWSDELEQFIRLVVPHVSRWGSFRMEVQAPDYGMPDPDPELPIKLASHFGTLHLPNLKSFELHIDDQAPGEPRNFDHFDFYTKWRMPRVYSIITSSLILASASSVFQLDAIRSFYFSHGLFDMHKLKDLLTSMPNLTDLSLNINDAQLGTFYSVVRSGCDVLPRLTSLSILICCLVSFRKIMQDLRMPMLRKLYIMIDGSRTSHPLDNWLNFIPAKTYGSVRELDFSFRIGRSAALSLLNLLDKFPGLERLDLNGPYESVYLGSGNVEIPPLRSMSLQLADPNDYYTIESFAQILKNSGRWDDFEYFQLKGATNPLTSAKHLAKEKLKWYAW